MLKREILLTSCAIVLALSGQKALAAEACTATPTCDALGYTATSCDLGSPSLKCPFNKKLLFCGAKTGEISCPPSTVYGPITNTCGAPSGDYILANGMLVGYYIAKNTMIPTNEKGSTSWSDAVNSCKNEYILSKRWRLPTLSELKAMYNNVDTLNSYLTGSQTKFSSAYYWSSDVDEAGNVWTVHMFSGAVKAMPKSDNARVRCVTNVK